MSDLLGFYLIIGLIITVLSLFSGETTQRLSEKSLLWNFMWVVLITTCWFPIMVIATIIAIRQAKKESEK
jgi:hypothetical protein